jgi:hypothetical protein
MNSTSQRVYNALVPYYAEVCVVTQYHHRATAAGGWGGHATLFVNGAELEAGAGYPRLRLVAHETDLFAPDSGTGISVNKIFKNVTWVAIPGRDRFFRGGLGDETTLGPGLLRHRGPGRDGGRLVRWHRDPTGGNALAYRWAARRSAR